MSVRTPDAAITPTARMTTEDAWRYNEDANIKLLCLRLFALQQRAHALHEPVPCKVRLGELLPCVNGEQLGQLVVRFATNHVVRAEVLSNALLPTTLLDLLAKTTLPFAAINKEKTLYADSILLLELDEPAPLSCCPDNIPVDEHITRRYKSIAPAHQKMLAVLLHNKLHLKLDDNLGEVFGLEYAKCIQTPIPFIFVLISDAPMVSKSITWPYNGNGYFVGCNQLQQFYGEFLYRIRAEAWLSH